MSVCCKLQSLREIPQEAGGLWLTFELKIGLAVWKMVFDKNGYTTDYDFAVSVAPMDLETIYENIIRVFEMSLS